MARRSRTSTIIAAILALAAVVAGWQKFRPGTLPDLIPSSPAPALRPGEIQVFFSPDGGCTQAIVRALNATRRQVRVQAYSFTSPEIARALVAAHKRGVEVKVLLDKSQETERYTEADFLSNQGVPVWIDASHAIAHNKIMILDGETIITGSFNFTRSAEERNAENLLILRASPELAARYSKNWEQHFAHCRAYKRPGG